MAVVIDSKHQVEIVFQPATQWGPEVLCLESREFPGCLQTVSHQLSPVLLGLGTYKGWLGILQHWI